MEASRTESVAGELPVRLEGLGKEYGHFTALKALDLTVPKGTSLGFLGPNGAGKSTAIKIMTNLIRPSRGRAALFGIDVRQEPTRALARIGAVIETPEFYGYLSPLETLAYVGRLRGMSSSEIEHRSEAVLKEVKLTDWADHRIQEFSKGMKQRLAIAQALLHEPELLILDEPTSGLDPRGKAEGDSTVDLRISGGEEGQARVLEAMVSRGLKVLTYRPLGSSLEQLYLDRIQESDRL